MLKCQFHLHTSEDPVDEISYTAKEAINKARTFNYDVLSITCHNKIIFNKDLRKYAEKEGILLIPGIEIEIGKKHILVINAKKEIENVKTFEDLKIYKNHHQDCLIIAPHPFFPGKVALKKALIENINLFDVIEYSFCYTKTKNYNKEAISLARRWRKPIIATSDCHTLNEIDLSFTLVNSKKDKIKIIEAIKNNKIKIITKPISYFKIFKILFTLNIRKILKKITLKKS